MPDPHVHDQGSQQAGSVLLASSKQLLGRAEQGAGFPPAAISPLQQQHQHPHALQQQEHPQQQQGRQHAQGPQQAGGVQWPWQQEAARKLLNYKHWERYLYLFWDVWVGREVTGGRGWASPQGGG
jgi:hypothetical protein